MLPCRESATATSHPQVFFELLYRLHGDSIDVEKCLDALSGV